MFGSGYFLADMMMVMMIIGCLRSQGYILELILKSKFSSTVFEKSELVFLNIFLQTKTLC